MSHYTIEQIKAQCEKEENHWFSKETMAFFGTRVSQRTYDGGAMGTLFVSSDLDYNSEDRRYSIRCAGFLGGGHYAVYTVGTFRKYATSKQAHAAARKFSEVLA